MAFRPEELKFVSLPLSKLLDGPKNIDLLSKSGFIEDIEVDGVLVLAGLLLRQALVHARVVLLHVDHCRGVKVLH